MAACPRWHRARTQNQHVCPAWRGQTLDTAPALHIPRMGSVPGGAGWCLEQGKAPSVGINHVSATPGFQGEPRASHGSFLSPFPRGKIGRICRLSGVL